MFYESGDVLLGKCEDSPPWPCIISHFLGYDEEEVQIYQVNFLATLEVANLETYNLTPVTKLKLDRMRQESQLSRKTRSSNQNYYYRSIRQAELKILALKEEAKKDLTKMDRFIKLYNQETNHLHNFIEIEHLRICPSTPSVTIDPLIPAKRQQTLGRLNFCQMSVSIETSCMSNYLVTVAIVQEEGTLATSVNNKKPWSLPRIDPEEQVTVEIHNWTGENQYK